MGSSWNHNSILSGGQFFLACTVEMSTTSLPCLTPGRCATYPHFDSNAIENVDSETESYCSGSPSQGYLTGTLWRASFPWSCHWQLTPPRITLEKGLNQAQPAVRMSLDFGPSGACPEAIRLREFTHVHGARWQGQDRRFTWGKICYFADQASRSTEVLVMMRFKRDICVVYRPGLPLGWWFIRGELSSLLQCRVIFPLWPYSGQGWRNCSRAPPRYATFSLM